MHFSYERLYEINMQIFWKWIQEIGSGTRLMTISSVMKHTDECVASYSARACTFATIKAENCLQIITKTPEMQMLTIFFFFAVPTLILHYFLYSSVSRHVLQTLLVYLGDLCVQAHQQRIGNSSKLKRTPTIHAIYWCACYFIS